LEVEHVYELHAWFGLAETTEESDVGGLEAALDDLDVFLDRFVPRPDVRWLNGQPFLTVDSAGNRPGATADALDGAVTVREDPFLSPCQPVIED
jgi:hypothetical protein